MMKRKILYQLLFIVLSLFPIIAWGEPYRVTEISHLEINSAISPATYDYLQNHFKKIPDGSLILIKLNTPGGLITTTKDIITLISSQDKPVAVWVTPEGATAASAGAIIAASAHFILMSRGTNMGAATPVGLGEDIAEKDGRAKMLNDLKAVVRSLSHSRGRPAEPFEEMVETAKSFTDQEALKLKIIDGVVSNQNTAKEILMNKNFILQGKPMQLIFLPEVISKIYEPTLGQKILNVLANPSTAYLLFLLGVALIYFEFQAPGGFISGGIGFGLLILAAISFQVLPLDWGAFALMVIGVVMLVMEVYITSYGLLGIGGVVSLVMGSLFLFHDETGFISVNYPILASTLLGVAFAVAIVVWYVLKENKKSVNNENFFLPVGSKGVVMSKTDELYQIKVRGEIWRGRSQQTLSVGESIQIISIDNEKLIADIIKSDKE